jgi:hypothetical protein
MQQHVIAEAWAAYNDAVRYDEKRIRLAREGKHQLAGTAGRAADRHLDRAIALEAAAFADTAVAA